MPHSVQAVKLVLTLAGIVCFAAGIRLDVVPLRWAGIGLVAAAWVLRFAKRRAD